MGAGDNNNRSERTQVSMSKSMQGGCVRGCRRDGGGGGEHGSPRHNLPSVLLGRYQPRVLNDDALGTPDRLQLHPVPCSPRTLLLRL